MLVRMVIWPPRANPKVTAGLTWPPEMLAPMATATKRAKPWQIAIATSPSGSRAASVVNLSAKRKSYTKMNNYLTNVIVSLLFASNFFIAFKL